MKRLMLTVAAFGLSLGAARLHLGLGIFVACIAIVALSRAIAVIDRHPGDVPITPWQRAAVLLDSIWVALAILVPSILTGIVLFSVFGTTSLSREHGIGVDWSPLVVALPAAGWTSSMIRRRLWPYRIHGGRPGDQVEAESPRELVKPGL